jgi:hypothetical protein
MSFRCRSCGSRDLSPSRFRWKDLAHLLILHSPKRCWVCRQRDYFPILRVSDRAESPTARWQFVRSR